MPKVAVYNIEGEKVGDLELKDEVFGVPVNEALMHQAVVRHLANQRQGTVATKTRAQVSGGGRKPWRQKGTGRARHGSTALRSGLAAEPPLALSRGIIGKSCRGRRAVQRCAPRSPER